MVIGEDREEASSENMPRSSNPHLILSRTWPRRALILGCPQREAYLDINERGNWPHRACCMWWVAAGDRCHGGHALLPNLIEIDDAAPIQKERGARVLDYACETTQQHTLKLNRLLEPEWLHA